MDGRKSGMTCKNDGKLAQGKQQTRGTLKHHTIITRQKMKHFPNAHTLTHSHTLATHLTLYLRRPLHSHAQRARRVLGQHGIAPQSLPELLNARRAHRHAVAVAHRPVLVLKIVDHVAHVLEQVQLSAGAPRMGKSDNRRRKMVREQNAAVTLFSQTKTIKNIVATTAFETTSTIANRW